MSLKFVIIGILYQFVISEEKSVEKVIVDSQQIDELENLLKDLELQIEKEHKIHKPTEKQKGNDIIKLLQSDHYDLDRSDEGILKYKDDRDCKAGRCGCSRGRCGDNKSESSSDEITKLLDSLEKTIDKDTGRYHSRCGRGRCGNHRDGKNNHLRCVGSKCERDRGDFDDKDDKLDLRDSKDLKLEDETYVKTYKLNNQLDAIVLKAENVDNVVKEINKHCSNYANCRVIDYSKTRANHDVDGGSDETNAVILDLTHLPDSNNIAKGLNNGLSKTAISYDTQKDYLTPNDLDRYYQNYKKTAFNDVIRYIKDKSGRRVLSVKNLSGKQKLLIEEIKTVLLKGGISLNDKEIVKQIEKILFGKDSSIKIYHHGEHNRNIYVPKSLYDRIEKPKKQSNLRAQKRLLPLTVKQRYRLFKTPVHSLRRKIDSASYGVPFDFQIQGLGQFVP